jgi:hypothetical protein
MLGIVIVGWGLISRSLDPERQAQIVGVSQIHRVIGRREMAPLEVSAIAFGVNGR